MPVILSYRGSSGLSFGKKFRRRRKKKATGNTRSPCTHTFTGPVVREGTPSTTEVTKGVPERSQK